MDKVLQDIKQDSSSIAFMSDLHLSPKTTALNRQFFDFLDKAATRFHCVYILGDLFCYWVGDDCASQWHLEVATKIKALVQSGCKVYFMPGNRDFLLGGDYLALSGMTLLQDPAVIELSGEKVLLKHGDDLCTADTFHQVFRWFSRTSLIKKLYLSLNQSVRLKIADKIRKKSQSRKLSMAKMQVVEAAIVKALSRNQAKRLICGHTHQPMVRYIQQKKRRYPLIILPDWDKKCGYVYYNQTNRFVFIYQ